jgi:hypothetical protein
MSKQKNSYFYDISVRGLKQPELFESEAEKVIKEISQVTGWDTPTRVCLEPVSVNKNLFSLSILTEANGQPVVVTKEGRRVLTLLNRVKRAVKKQIREIQYKDLNRLRSERRGHPHFSLVWDIL